MIIYQKLTDKELDRFIQMRIRQLREEGAAEDIDLVPALQDYYNRHMADGTFVSWLAMDRDKIVGTSGMSFVEKPPYFGCPSGKIGLLSSIFTDPEYRRRGIAKELLSRVVDEARAYGCGTVQITASDMGVLLYTDTLAVVLYSNRLCPDNQDCILFLQSNSSHASLRREQSWNLSQASVHQT